MGALDRFEKGDVIGDRFEVTRKIAAGGMGSVLAAIDRRSGREVALKLMHRSLRGDDTMAERFRREASVLQAIDHPTIVAIEDAGALPDGTLFLALELLKGETLADRLGRLGPMRAEELLPVVRGLCGGLAAAHDAGVIHRDVKPANIFLPTRDAIRRATLSGETPVVKLVDFGIAKVFREERLTQTGLALGTLRYMAPEQLAGETPDARCDVYSLGVVLYEALAGESPFAGSGELVDAILHGAANRLGDVYDCGVAIEAVVMRAMARDASRRYATARELSDAYRDAVLQPDALPTDGERGMRVVTGEMRVTDAQLWEAIAAGSRDSDRPPPGPEERPSRLETTPAIPARRADAPSSDPPDASADEPAGSPDGDAAEPQVEPVAPGEVDDGEDTIEPVANVPAVEATSPPAPAPPAPTDRSRVQLAPLLLLAAAAATIAVALYLLTS